MTFPRRDEGRRPHHADTWPSDLPVQPNGVDASTWQCSPTDEPVNPTQSQSRDSSGSQSLNTSQSDDDSGQRGRYHFVQDPQLADDNGSPDAIDPSSTTPNARGSRLFRERRKERERILRETVTELAERNTTLEALLLRHGIVPPISATLRHDLSIHRSQRQGGPPIHIPGVTALRPPPIASRMEPGNNHGRPSPYTSESSSTRESASASPHSSMSFYGGQRSYHLEGHQSTPSNGSGTESSLSHSQVST